MENKFSIRHKLADTLRETRMFEDELLFLEFHPAGETDGTTEDHVTAVFESRPCMYINVHADSGIALIQDVLRALARI
jgi:hypothetical protein